MLRAAGKGTRKTRIMGVANLSYRLFEKYLRDTVQVGFLRMNDDGYEVTEKGQDFLEKYISFSNRYSKVESELQSVLSEGEALKKMCQPSGNGKVGKECGRRRRK